MSKEDPYTRKTSEYDPDNPSKGTYVGPGTASKENIKYPLTGYEIVYGIAILLFIILTIFLIVITIPFFIWAIVLIIIEQKKKKYSIRQIFNRLLIPHFYIIEYYSKKD